ncbi:hypothetical protein GJAV_G00053680 [Gymnothorax javanicus]|nr:hypothetical protein GJAV_G00053680 [Gymnothorax javanicus]
MHHRAAWVDRTRAVRGPPRTRAPVGHPPKTGLFIYFKEYFYLKKILTAITLSEGSVSERTRFQALFDEENVPDSSRHRVLR